MSFTTPAAFDKEQIIDTLLKHQCFKMPDGRQLYEATHSELQSLICSKVNDQYTFCSYSSEFIHVQ
ncbi:Fur-regulated basic protein FbpA [Halalkalibacter akibai]|uniref:Fur-regulated basic protein FbpA n=1 Tax=Halalkalibacter akibai TaxID=1411 RepID=UPI000552B9CD|nr:Fur-regulated basic protein FbpA [Halalkalibacter akibai]